MMRSLVSLDIDQRVERLKVAAVFRLIDHPAFFACLAETMVEISMQGNHPILHQNEAVKSLYCLIEGRAKIHLDDIKMAELSPGAFFGDINVFESQPYSVSVTSLEPSRCLVLDHQQLQMAMDCYPEIQSALMAGLYSQQQSRQLHSWRKSVVQEWFTKSQKPHWAYAS